MDTLRDVILPLFLPGLSVIVTAIIVWLANAIVDAIQKHTALKINEQQRAILVNGADNAAGTLITLLLAKLITPETLSDPASQHVTDLAGGVIDRLASQAAAVKVTKEEMAQVIVGRAGQLLAKQPTPVVVATS